MGGNVQIYKHVDVDIYIFHASQIKTNSWIGHWYITQVFESTMSGRKMRLYIIIFLRERKLPKWFNSPWHYAAPKTFIYWCQQYARLQWGIEKFERWAPHCASCLLFALLSPPKTLAVLSPLPHPREADMSALHHSAPAQCCLAWEVALGSLALLRLLLAQLSSPWFWASL